MHGFDLLLNVYARCLIFEHIHTDVFAVLMEDFREARLARRNSKTVEKRYGQAVLQQFFAVAVGPFSHEEVLRCKLVKITPQARGNGSTVDSGGTGSHGESSSGTRGAAFWLWRHTAKRSKTRTLVVARALKRKDTQLLLSGWASLKKFEMLCHFQSYVEESQGSLRVLKSLKYSVQTSSSFLSLSCDKVSDSKISQVLGHAASLLTWIDNKMVTFGERCQNILVQEAQTICRDIQDVPAARTGGGADAVCTRSFEQSARISIAMSCAEGMATRLCSLPPGNIQMSCLKIDAAIDPGEGV
jgi:hypothetical protein